MKIIRRLYLYAVTLVSLETVLWGVIGLARSFFSGPGRTGDATRLAQALSLILVGVPVFLLHFWLAQRGARQDEEERAARLRAVFLYAALMATLVPVVQNIFAWIDQTLILNAGLEPWRAIAGGDQTWVDHVIAIAGNALVAAGIFYLLRKDWSSGIPAVAWRQVRRLYRYIWVVYGLVFSVVGLIQVIDYLLKSSIPELSRDSAMLPNGLALAIVGLPVWLISERIVQVALKSPEEQGASLRLVILYLISLISIAGLLVAAGVVINRVLFYTFKAQGALLGGIAGPLATVLIFGAVWVYYGRNLRNEIKILPGEPFRVDLRRLFHYLLSFGGLATAFFGVQQLIFVLSKAVFRQASLVDIPNRTDLASGLATLLIGLPLWIVAWQPVKQEARLEGEAGDRARRSVIRKAYLYLALFASVIGIMFSTGVLIYLFLLPVLGERVNDLPLQVFQQLRLVVLFGLVLLIHGRILRRDNRLAERSLARRHAQFPILILVMDGDAASASSLPAGEETVEAWDKFAGAVVNALHQHAPNLPVAVHQTSQGAPDDTLSAARAVILPAGLLARPSEAVRLWLQSFAGDHIVVPTPAKGWQWISARHSLIAMANQTAQTVRQLAEGEQPTTVQETPGWMWVVYIFAGLFALELLMALVSVFVNL